MDQPDRSLLAAVLAGYPFGHTGWFELRDEAGRWLGLIDTCVGLLDWLAHRPPGRAYRITHRFGDEVTGRWIGLPRAGRRPLLWPVNRFG